MAKSAPISKFELLPTELRLQIYTHLGFPTSKLLPLHCAQEYTPEQPSCPGQYANSIRLAGINFLDPHGKKTEPILESNGHVVHLPDICGNKGCGLRPLKKERWIEMATGLMGVNRRVHAEVCDVLYSSITASFDFQLSDSAMHKLESNQRHNSSKLTRMAMSNTTLSYLTRIALSDQIGIHNTSAKPRFTPAFCRRVLRRHISSLIYISTHCPHLQILTHSPHPFVLRRCRQTHLDLLIEALVDIVARSRNLQRLAIEAFQHKPRCGCYGEMRQTRMDGHESMRQALIREVLTWDDGKRPGADEVAFWAKGVLVGIKKCEQLVMKCPNACKDRQVMSLLGGRYAR